MSLIWNKNDTIDSTLIAGRKLEAETISAVIGFLASIDPARFQLYYACQTSNRVKLVIK